MIRGGKTCWKAIRVRGPGAEPRELDPGERLAALYRFQNGEVSADHCFVTVVDGQRGVPVSNPSDVDWDTFPVLAALEAVTRDELRRLRSILRADPANPPPSGPPRAVRDHVDAEPPAPTSSGTWALPLFTPRPVSSREA